MPRKALTKKAKFVDCLGHYGRRHIDGLLVEMVSVILIWRDHSSERHDSLSRCSVTTINDMMFRAYE